MSRHAEGYRKRDMHSGIPSEEYTAGYELAFPEGDVPRFLPCGHSAGWREGAVCGVCGAPADGSTAPLSIAATEPAEFEVGERIEVPAHELIPGLAPDTSPPGPPLVVTYVGHARGAVTLNGAPLPPLAAADEFTTRRMNDVRSALDASAVEVEHRRGR